MTELSHGAIQTVVVTAFWCVGGNRLVTWGDPEYGGDSSRGQDQLRNVQQVCRTFGALAAILADGTVVTWGARHIQRPR